MNLSFNVMMTANDMFKFNLKNAYKSLQGVMSIIGAALIIFVLIWKFEVITPLYVFLFILLAVLFLVYIPATLFLKSKQAVVNNKVFTEPLQFDVDEEKIVVTAIALPEEEAAVLPWNKVFSVRISKTQILIYSNRKNAYIIPRSQIEDVEEQLINMIRNNVEGFKLHGI